jgi:hypothetical protein
MQRSRIIVALACGLAAGVAGPAGAGAPQPETRSGDFVHVCQGGAKKGLPCTVPNQAADCPGSACIAQPLTNAVRGTLTIIAHDSVTDWLRGGGNARALTVLLEVKGEDGSKQMLAATYQDLVEPTSPPSAPTNVISIAMDEEAAQGVALAPGGLVFVQPESILAQRLQALFGSTGTPVIVATDRRTQSADHTGDGLATVVRFKVKVQFLAPAA